MRFKDVKLRVNTDYEFWYKLIMLLELFLTKTQEEDSSITAMRAIPTTLKEVYATAMTLPQDDPFSGQAFNNLVAAFNERRDKPITRGALTDYKKRLKKANWLDSKGKLPQAVLRLKQDYEVESKQGIKSISMILKLCVC